MTLWDMFGLIIEELQAMQGLLMIGFAFLALVAVLQVAVIIVVRGLRKEIRNARRA